MIDGTPLAQLVADHIGNYIQFLRYDAKKKDDRTPEKWWTEFLGETRKLKLTRKKYTRKPPTKEEIQVEKLIKKAAARDDDQSLLEIKRLIEETLKKRGLTGE